MDLDYSDIDPSWEPIFQISLPELRDTQKYMPAGTVYPKKEDIFNAFKYTPLDQVKVVIIGQDPYPGQYKNGDPEAMGLSFSTRGAPAASLINIFKEVKNCYPDFVVPETGDLTKWAKQGVLLLNTCLTVQAGKPKSHGHIWDGFIWQVIRAICTTNPDAIFVLWGKEAEKIKKLILPKNPILISGHPSPLSVKFFAGNQHFLKINELLGPEKAIDWSL